MDDATGDDATNNTAVKVDEVLDKLLDHTIEVHGLSARDVYRAIFAPALAENSITRALSGQNYDYPPRNCRASSTAQGWQYLFGRHLLNTYDGTRRECARSHDTCWFRSPL